MIEVIPKVRRIKCFKRLSPTLLLCRLYHSNAKFGPSDDVATNPSWISISDKSPYVCTLEGITLKRRKIKKYKTGDPIVASGGPGPYGLGYRINCKGENS